MLLSFTALYPQGAMGFPGMLGQKVSKRTHESWTTFWHFIFCYPEAQLQKCEQTEMLSWGVICRSGRNGSKGRTWNLREQRTHGPTREKRQAGEVFVGMWTFWSHRFITFRSNTVYGVMIHLCLDSESTIGHFEHRKIWPADQLVHCFTCVSGSQRGHGQCWSYGTCRPSGAPRSPWPSWFTCHRWDLLPFYSF